MRWENRTSPLENFTQCYYSSNNGAGHCCKELLLLKRMNDFPGGGGSRPQIESSIERLLLDTNNPRLPEDYQGKSGVKILECLRRDFDLEELAYSMDENGYFDEEPLVAVPHKLPQKFIGKSDSKLKLDPSYIEFINNISTKLVVVEGNRRLATIIILLSEKLQNELKATNWPKIGKGNKKTSSKPG